MLEIQRLELRASEIRTRLAELGGISELTDEQRSEIDTLRNEYGDVEKRTQALIIAGDTPSEPVNDSEKRELDTLVDRANMGAIFTAALERRNTDGVERELQQHYGIEENAVPLVMLRRNAVDDLELRTTGQTAAPTDTGQQPHAIIPYVFPQSAASFMGIMQETVPVGDQVYTVLTTAAAPGTPAGGAEQAHGKAIFMAETLSPARIQASLFYRREDRARLMGMDAALRENLSDALADELDDVVITDLLTGTTLAANAAMAADTYASYRSRMVYSNIDGSYASVSGDLRILVGSDTYGDMAGTYRANEDSMNALGALMAETSGVRVSAHVPATASMKQQALVRRGARMDYALGIWEGVQLIVDEVTQAAEGEIVITAVMLHAKQLLRAAGFAKVEAQHS